MYDTARRVELVKRQIVTLLILPTSQKFRETVALYVQPFL